MKLLPLPNPHLNLLDRGRVFRIEKNTLRFEKKMEISMEKISHTIVCAFTLIAGIIYWRFDVSLWA
jgi:hypothetical protein